VEEWDTATELDSEALCVAELLPVVAAVITELGLAEAELQLLTLGLGLPDLEPVVELDTVTELLVTTVLVLHMLVVGLWVVSRSVPEGVLLLEVEPVAEPLLLSAEEAEELGVGVTVPRGEAVPLKLPEGVAVKVKEELTLARAEVVPPIRVELPLPVTEAVMQAD